MNNIKSNNYELFITSKIDITFYENKWMLSCSQT